MLSFLNFRFYGSADDDEVFNERAQDAVGSIVDTTLLYSDITPHIGRAAISGDIVIPAGSNTAAIGAGVIVNADVNASAGITLTKLEATTASRALVSDGSGFIVAATTTATELGYVNGVTSAIQTQLNAKQPTITPAALTKADDANVTLTLGGSAATALLNAASISAGWSGTLSAARGGTGTVNTGTLTYSGSASVTGTNTGDQTITLTGDVTGTGTGSFVTAIGAGVIINTDVNASAAIALTKLAATTASRALVSDGSGFVTAATTTATEIGYVNGVTSAIQTQLNGKQATGNYITALTGDIAASGPGSAAATLATVNPNTGTFGSGTQTGVLTFNGKGLITSASQVTITPAVGSITGLGTGVATFLATPSSANLLAAVTDENGTGALVFATSPSFTTPSLGAATATSLQINGSTVLTNITASTYTPTLTNTTNIAASTPFTTQYIRVNNMVTVFGQVNIDPTATGAISLGMSLPIASNIGSASQVGGVAMTASVAGQALSISGDATSDFAVFAGVTTDAANRPYYFQFGYQII